MASPHQVKEYLAVWLQLGKRVAIANGQSYLAPSAIREGDRYSHEFEAIWQSVLATPGIAYLEGTHQTIQELLSPEWEISHCARCTMLVPTSHHLIRSDAMVCPCIDLPTWPNTDLPLPHPLISSTNHIHRIYDRLQSSNTVKLEPKQ